MASAVNRHLIDPHEDLLRSIAVSSEQIEATARPDAGSDHLLENDQTRRGEDWRRDPDLVRALNDRLAQSTR